MSKQLFVVVIFCTLFYQLHAQILPKEGSSLHYRIIGFSFPPVKKANKYQLEIARGYYNNRDSFSKNIVSTLTSGVPEIIAEVPSFGTVYTWHITYNQGNGEFKNGKLYHFRTEAVPYVDTNNIRLRIIRPAAAYKDAYVFVDGNKALYDMNGRPVWFLPTVNGVVMNANTGLRDIKILPAGTITFLLEEQAFEINYNATVLWKGPDNGAVGGDSTEHYHHELTRLSNGHYMVLGSELSLARQKLKKTLTGVVQDDNTKPAADSFYDKISFGTIIEYDKKGNVIWSWKSSKYFIGSDLRYFNIPTTMPVIDVHENAFHFDENNKNIYVSFRHISRMLKVKYPEGNVVNTYGEIFKKDVPQSGNGYFCGQHGLKRSNNGYLYFFNNGCNPEHAPKVTLMQERTSDKDDLKIIWEYECNLEGLRENHHKVYWFPTGGNVVELPDSSIFVCTGSDCDKLFIVNRNKEELWSATPEIWSPEAKQWGTISQYRASIIPNRKELERLIWNAEIKE